MEKIITVNCISCGNPITQFWVEELKELKVNIRCVNCRLDQYVICEKVFQIRVIPKEKLSTGHIVAGKVKIVV